MDKNNFFDENFFENGILKSLEKILIYEKFLENDIKIFLDLFENKWLNLENLQKNYQKKAQKDVKII